MTDTIMLNVTYEVTKTIRTEVDIDRAEFNEWVGDGSEPTDELVREFLESGDDYTLKSLLGEDLGYNAYVQLENVEVCDTKL